jgi:hypothetical protein
MLLNKRMSFVDFRRYETSFAKHGIRNVNIDNLPLLKSLQGLPTSISGNIDIKNCNSLRQLDLRLQIGVGVDDQMIEIQRCNRLSSLKNFPTFTVDSEARKHMSVILDRLPCVTRLQDLPMTVDEISIAHIPLTSLSGFPKTIRYRAYLSDIGIRDFGGLCVGTSCNTLILRGLVELETFAGIHMKFDRLNEMIINMGNCKRQISGMMDLAQLLVHLNTRVTFITSEDLHLNTRVTFITSEDPMNKNKAIVTALEYDELLKQFSDIVNDGSVLPRVKLMRISRMFNDVGASALM